MKKEHFKLKIKKRTLLLIDWANVYGWKKSLNWEVCPKKLFSYFNRPKIIDKRLYYGIDIYQTKSKNFKMEIEKLGFQMISKNVKWTPVSLEKSHFKKIVKELFDVLDDVKNKNSEISTKLYELNKKIDGLPKVSIGNEKQSFSLSNKKQLIEIFDLIEELDLDLRNLNIEIGELQESLKIPVLRRKCDFDVEITRDALNAINDFDTLILFSGDGDYSALSEDLIQKGKKVILIFAAGHIGKEYKNIKSRLFYACPIDKLKNVLKK